MKCNVFKEEITYLAIESPRREYDPAIWTRMPLLSAHHLRPIQRYMPSYVWLATTEDFIKGFACIVQPLIDWRGSQEEVQACSTFRGCLKDF